MLHKKIIMKDADICILYNYHDCVRVVKYCIGMMFEACNLYR